MLRTRWRRRIALVVLPGAMIASLLAVAPAQASVITYACDPSPTTWNVAAAWPDGTVAEVRRCIQHDSATGKVRERSEMRVRNGTNPDSGADWDFDNNGDNRGLIIWVYDLDCCSIVTNNNFPDEFNQSYVVKYTSWGCRAASFNEYYGADAEWRVTPTGLSRSGYKDGSSDVAFDGLAQC
jgi:hypothetical protein